MQRSSVSAGQREDGTLQQIYRNLIGRNYLEPSPSELIECIPAADWIGRLWGDIERGFRKKSVATTAGEKVVLYLLRILESLIGRPFYIKLKAGEDIFFRIEPRFLKVIEDLKERAVIRSVHRCEAPPDFPIIPNYAFRFAPLTTAGGRRIWFKGALSGGGIDSNSALAAALAETIERYSLFNWDESRVIHGTFDELQRERNVLDPMRFKAFSDRQLADPAMRKQHYFDHGTPFDWVEVEALSSGERFWAPAQMAYLGYRGSVPEPTIRRTTTNGAATGDTRDRAIYAALCENVERDAFLIYWLNKIPPPRIDEETISDSYSRRLLAQAKQYGLETSVFEIATDIAMPTFLVFSHDPSGIVKGVRVSAAARLDAEEAVRHALIENVKGFAYTREIMSDDKIAAAQRAFPDLDIESRLHWWGEKAHLAEIDWLFSGPTRPLPQARDPLEDYERKKEKVKALFAEAGHEAYLRDATGELAHKHGLRVVISLIPDFVPLYLDERVKYLGVERLYSQPVKLGLLAEPRTEAEMNAVPHPMD